MLESIKAIFWKKYRTCDRNWHTWLYVGPQNPRKPEICLEVEVSRTCRYCGVKYQMVGWKYLIGIAAGQGEYLPIYSKSYINPGNDYQI